MPTVLFADEVFLKGAGTISGKIVEQTETTVMVDIGSGVMGVPMAHVDRIVKGRSPLNDYAERAGHLGPQDVDGWRKLGGWASQQGLSVQSREAYRKVLDLAPNDREANEAMGFVLLEGRWVPEEEAYRARGYVKFDGEWMTPAEAQRFRDSEAADQARQDAEQRAREADTEKLLAETRAAKAAERAADQQAREREEARWSQPVYWGGWGYGVNSWPSAPVSNYRPAGSTP